MADAHAFIPRLHILAVGAPNVGGYHATQRSIHEECDAAGHFLDTRIEWAAEVWA